MGAPSKQDWAKIHAKAWLDDGFKQQLETNPLSAVKQYGEETGQQFDKVIDIGDKPDGVADEDLHKHHIPPACC